MDSFHNKGWFHSLTQSGGFLKARLLNVFISRDGIPGLFGNQQPASLTLSNGGDPRRQVDPPPGSGEHVLIFISHRCNLASHPPSRQTNLREDCARRQDVIRGKQHVRHAQKRKDSSHPPQLGPRTDINIMYISCIKEE